MTEAYRLSKNAIKSLESEAVARRGLYLSLDRRADACFRGDKVGVYLELCRLRNSDLSG